MAPSSVSHDWRWVCKLLSNPDFPPAKLPLVDTIIIENGRPSCHMYLNEAGELRTTELRPSDSSRIVDLLSKFTAGSARANPDVPCVLHTSTGFPQLLDMPSLLGNLSAGFYSGIALQPFVLGQGVEKVSATFRIEYIHPAFFNEAASFGESIHNLTSSSTLSMNGFGEEEYRVFQYVEVAGPDGAPSSLFRLNPGYLVSPPLPLELTEPMQSVSRQLKYYIERCSPDSCIVKMFVDFSLDDAGHLWLVCAPEVVCIAASDAPGGNPFRSYVSSNFHAPLTTEEEEQRNRARRSSLPAIIPPAASTSGDATAPVTAEAITLSDFLQLRAHHTASESVARVAQLLFQLISGQKQTWPEIQQSLRGPGADAAVLRARALARAPLALTEARLQGVAAEFRGFLEPLIQSGGAKRAGTHILRIASFIQSVVRSALELVGCPTLEHIAALQVVAQRARTAADMRIKLLEAGMIRLGFKSDGGEFSLVPSAAMVLSRKSVSQSREPPSKQALAHATYGVAPSTRGDSLAVGAGKRAVAQLRQSGSQQQKMEKILQVVRGRRARAPQKNPHEAFSAGELPVSMSGLFSCADGVTAIPWIYCADPNELTVGLKLGSSAAKAPENTEPIVSTTKFILLFSDPLTPHETLLKVLGPLRLQRARLLIVALPGAPGVPFALSAPQQPLPNSLFGSSTPGRAGPALCPAALATAVQQLLVYLSGLKVLPDDLRFIKETSSVGAVNPYSTLSAEAAGTEDLIAGRRGSLAPPQAAPNNKAARVLAPQMGGGLVNKSASPLNGAVVVGLGIGGLVATHWVAAYAKSAPFHVNSLTLVNSPVAMDTHVLTVARSTADALEAILEPSPSSETKENEPAPNKDIILSKEKDLAGASYVARLVLSDALDMVSRADSHSTLPGLRSRRQRAEDLANDILRCGEEDSVPGSSTSLGRLALMRGLLVPSFTHLPGVVAVQQAASRSPAQPTTLATAAAAATHLLALIDCPVVTVSTSSDAFVSQFSSSAAARLRPGARFVTVDNDARAQKMAALQNSLWNSYWQQARQNKSGTANEDNELALSKQELGTIASMTHAPSIQTYEQVGLSPSAILAVCNVLQASTSPSASKSRGRSIQSRSTNVPKYGALILARGGHSVVSERPLLLLDLLLTLLEPARARVRAEPLLDAELCDSPRGLARVGPLLLPRLFPRGDRHYNSLQGLPGSASGQRLLDDTSLLKNTELEGSDIKEVESDKWGYFQFGARFSSLLDGLAAANGPSNPSVASARFDSPSVVGSTCEKEELSSYMDSLLPKEPTSTPLQAVMEDRWEYVCHRAVLFQLSLSRDFVTPLPDLNSALFLSLNSPVSCMRFIEDECSTWYPSGLSPEMILRARISENFMRFERPPLNVVYAGVLMGLYNSSIAVSEHEGENHDSTPKLCININNLSYSGGLAPIGGGPTSALKPPLEYLDRVAMNVCRLALRVGLQELLDARQQGRGALISGALHGTDDESLGADISSIEFEENESFRPDDTSLSMPRAASEQLQAIRSRVRRVIEGGEHSPGAELYLDHLRHLFLDTRKLSLERPVWSGFNEKFKRLTMEDAVSPRVVGIPGPAISKTDGVISLEGAPQIGSVEALRLLKRKNTKSSATAHGEPVNNGADAMTGKFISPSKNSNNSSVSEKVKGEEGRSISRGRRGGVTEGVDAEHLTNDDKFYRHALQKEARRASVVAGGPLDTAFTLESAPQHTFITSAGAADLAAASLGVSHHHFVTTNNDNNSKSGGGISESAAELGDGAVTKEFREVGSLDPLAVYNHLYNPNLHNTAFQRQNNPLGSDEAVLEQLHRDTMIRRRNSVVEMHSRPRETVQVPPPVTEVTKAIYSGAPMPKEEVYFPPLPPKFVPPPREEPLTRLIRLVDGSLDTLRALDARAHAGTLPLEWMRSLQRLRPFLGDLPDSLRFEPAATRNGFDATGKLVPRDHRNKTVGLLEDLDHQEEENAGVYGNAGYDPSVLNGNSNNNTNNNSGAELDPLQSNYMDSEPISGNLELDAELPAYAPLLTQAEFDRILKLPFAMQERRREEAERVRAARVRAEEAAERARRLDAAITIQCAIRCFLARKLASKLRLSRRLRSKGEKAVLRIQRIVRADPHLFSNLRARRLMRTDWMRHNGALALQRLWRGYTGRAEFELVRASRAALRIQCFWRCALARSIVRLRKAELRAFEHYERAATVIQAHFRGFLARQDYHELWIVNQCALSVQRCWRRHVAAREFRRLQMISWLPKGSSERVEQGLQEIARVEKAYLRNQARVNEMRRAVDRLDYFRSSAVKEIRRRKRAVEKIDKELADIAADEMEAKLVLADGVDQEGDLRVMQMQLKHARDGRIAGKFHHKFGKYAYGKTKDKYKDSSKSDAVATAATSPSSRIADTASMNSKEKKSEDSLSLARKSAPLGTNSNIRLEKSSAEVDKKEKELPIRQPLRHLALLRGDELNRLSRSLGIPLSAGLQTFINTTINNADPALSNSEAPPGSPGSPATAPHSMHAVLADVESEMRLGLREAFATACRRGEELRTQRRALCVELDTWTAREASLGSQLRELKSALTRNSASLQLIADSLRRLELQQMTFVEDARPVEPAPPPPYAAARALEQRVAFIQGISDGIEAQLRQTEEAIHEAMSKMLPSGVAAMIMPAMNMRVNYSALLHDTGNDTQQMDELLGPLGPHGLLGPKDYNSMRINLVPPQLALQDSPPLLQDSEHSQNPLLLSDASHSRDSRNSELSVRDSRNSRLSKSDDSEDSEDSGDVSEKKGSENDISNGPAPEFTPTSVPIGGLFNTNIRPDLHFVTQAHLLSQRESEATTLGSDTLFSRTTPSALAANAQLHSITLAEAVSSRLRAPNPAAFLTAGSDLTLTALVGATLSQAGAQAAAEAELSASERQRRRQVRAALAHQQMQQRRIGRASASAHPGINVNSSVLARIMRSSSRSAGRSVANTSSGKVGASEAALVAEGVSEHSFLVLDPATRPLGATIQPFGRSIEVTLREPSLATAGTLSIAEFNATYARPHAAAAPARQALPPGSALSFKSAATASGMALLRAATATANPVLDAYDAEMERRMQSNGLLPGHLAGRTPSSSHSSVRGGARPRSGSREEKDNDRDTENPSGEDDEDAPRSNAYERHQQKLRALALEAASKPFPPALSEWRVQDCVRWLHCILLGQYAPRFEQAQVTGDFLLTLQTADFRDILGVLDRAHLAVLLAERENLRRADVRGNVNAGLPQDMEKFISTAASREARAAALLGSQGARLPPLAAVASMIAGGKTRSVEKILRLGFPVNATDDDGCSLLFYAARYGQKRIVDLLLANGENINKQNERGNTPLHFIMDPVISAMYDPDGSLAKYLIKHGARKDIKNVEGLLPSEGIGVAQSGPILGLEEQQE